MWRVASSAHIQLPEVSADVGENFVAAQVVTFS
jgi:hypothetical protein